MTARMRARGAGLALALLLAGCWCTGGAGTSEDRGTDAARARAPRCEVLSGGLAGAATPAALQQVSPATCLRLGTHGVLQPQPLSSAAFPRAHVESRLARAARTGALALVAFGGSVTAGHGGLPPTYLVNATYGALFADWLRRAYADAGVRVEFHNYALPAVSASVPALCAHALLNGTAPDVVLLEFSVNADHTEWSLLRLAATLAALPSRPVLLYVDTFTARALDRERGAGWEDAPRVQLPVALGAFDQVALRRLNLTCFSVGAALSAGDAGSDDDDGAAVADELRALLHAAHSEDRTHLSSAGHALLAELLAQHFATLRLAAAAATSEGEADADDGDARGGEGNIDSGTCYSRATTPLALLRPSTRWSYGVLHGHDKEGWHLDGAGEENVGARAVFTLRLRADSEPQDVIGISAMVNGVRNLYGIAEVSLDGVAIGTFDGYANTTFNTQVTNFFRAPKPLLPGSAHALRLRMASDTSSGGHDFALVAVIAARDCPLRPHGDDECMSSPHGPLGTVQVAT
jgi:hypothetical protein